MNNKLKSWEDDLFGPDNQEEQINPDFDPNREASLLRDLDTLKRKEPEIEVFDPKDPLFQKDLDDLRSVVVDSPTKIESKIPTPENEEMKFEGAGESERDW